MTTPKPDLHLSIMRVLGAIGVLATLAIALWVLA